MYFVVDLYVIGTFAAQAVLVLFWLALLVQNYWKPAFSLVRWVQQRALFLAAVTATLATAGSLYFSEVMRWTPCLFCWYQRIAIFPQVFLLWPAWKHKFRAIVWYTVPLASIGLLFALYHWFLQLSPADISTACVTAGGVSCVGRYIYTGPLTIAGMAVTTLASIITLVLLQAKK